MEDGGSILRAWRFRYEVRRGYGGTVGIVSRLEDEEVPHVALDLSPGGCFILSRQSLVVGDVLVATIGVPDRPEITLFGRVVHVRRSRGAYSGFGIAFLDPTPLQRIVLREACRRLPPPVPRSLRLHYLPRASAAVPGEAPPFP